MRRVIYEARGGPPIMFGGGAELLASATRAGLIDDDEPLKLRLTDSTTFPSGAVRLEYARREEPR